MTALKLPARLAALAVAGLLAASAAAQGPAGPPKDGPPKPEFPPYDQVTKGYEKVVSTTDGAAPLYTLLVDKKEGKILAELPPDYAAKKYFVAMTVASGELYAGLQAGEYYVYWKRYGDTLALIQKDVETRSTGDKESRASVERLFTDKLLADTPILTLSPRGGPVISLDNLLVLQAPKFFGFMPGPDDMRALMKFKTIKTAKAFPKNVELGVEVPLSRGGGRYSFFGGGGTLKTLHYSISEIPDETGYKPRVADDRVGYFTTGYDDLGKTKDTETRTRYINRWHLEKADPSLKMSPPKNPIVFYIEHTTPIRYRRYVKDGILYWNQAFEKVGLIDAIQVHQQDAATGAHMDKDPEDVRYNFVRWLNNNIGTAIGPSRVHPLTGQIIDADIILTDGWIRHFDQQFHELLPQLATEGMNPETYSWLEDRPMWDPRVALAPAHDRTRMLTAWGQGHRIAHTPYRAQTELEAILGRNAKTGYCLASHGKTMDLALLLSTEVLAQAGGKKDEEEKLDGIPAKFVGPLLADLVAHEVGHTLGLRHNFAATGLYSFAEINSNKIKGKKPFAGSVMDYIPVNIDMKDGETQGDYAMIGVGPYDIWAIEYGYTFESDLKPILAKSSLPENRFATDQDTMGPDPLARRYDFSANPLDYAKNQLKLAEYHRARLIDKFVQDGKSWADARRQYDMTLGLQVRSLSMMANWVGGAHVRRDHKGTGTKPPVEAVTPAAQREALKWVIDNAFNDKSFGLTPALLQHMKHDTLSGDEYFMFGEEGTYPVHDRVMGIQSAVLTMLMNPTRLRRIYDNELLVEADKDAVTIPELLDALYAAVWTEVDKKPDGKFTARKPMIASTRRNLQRTYVERLIDLAVNGTGSGAASKPISNLAMLQLRTLNDKIGTVLKAEGMTAVDPYTRAHLSDAQTRITKALDSQYILNARDIGGGGRGMGGFYFDGQPRSVCTQQGCQTCAPAGLGWNDPRPQR